MNRPPMSRPPFGSGSGNSNGNRPYNRPSGRYVDQTRVNERIRAPKVRVVDGDTNAQLGVMATAQALRMAKDRALDLVEVAPNADPPVCKIVNYGKYKYIQEKHKKEAHKHQKASKLKEMKFRIGIDPHDYLIKIVHVEEFLAEGHKVRIQLQFRGRQMAHQELGFELAKRLKTDLATMGHVDSEPRMAGRNINMQISPLPERQRVRKFKNVYKGELIDPDEDHIDEPEDHPDFPHHEKKPQEQDNQAAAGTASAARTE